MLSSSRMLSLTRSGRLNTVPVKTLLTHQNRRIFSVIQSGLTQFQALTDLPMWATLALSTVLVRTSLLPLVRLQIIASQKISTAMPEIATLYKLLMQNLSPKSANTYEQKKQAIRSFKKGFLASLVIHDASITPMIMYPIINISVFLSFVLSVRDMIAHDETGDLCIGGMLWFEDLSVSDPTFILPVAGMAVSYTALELAFRGGAGVYMPMIKDFLQCCVLVALPMTTTLPCGVFCYWIPSSLYAISQNILLKHPVVMKALRIPPMPKPPSFKLPSQQIDHITK